MHENTLFVLLKFDLSFFSFSACYWSVARIFFFFFGVGGGGG